MPTPLQFMEQYRNLQIPAVVEDPVGLICRLGFHSVTIRKYFMMDWKQGSNELSDYNLVTKGSGAWYRQNKEAVRNAAMGKGSPADYAKALEWAVRSGGVATPTPATLQAFSDNHLGIDCSGFVTNYLIALGKRGNADATKRNTNAASYYSAAHAVNDPTLVKPGDLLVWLTGNGVKTSPGHVAVVQSYVAASTPGGNMEVVEATGASGANPKLLCSRYSVEQIINKDNSVPTMILVVKRHGMSGDRVAVMRW